MMRAFRQIASEPPLPSRDLSPLPWLEDSFKDAAFALRQVRNAPGFTAVAMFSLALGIGANTAIFTIIESTLLRPIAVPHPESLRLLTWKTQPHGWVAANIGSLSPTFGTIYEQRETADGGIMHTDFSPRIYESFRRNNNVFESIFAFKEFGRLTAVVDGNAEAVNCFLVSGDFYRGMEMAPVIGRPIGPDDDVRTQAGSVVLISYQYWTRRFARSPSVIGKRIILNAAPVTIIGVNPEYFAGVEPGAHFEIWAPLNLPQAFQGRILHGAEFTPQSTPSLLDDDRSFILPLMGRLKRGYWTLAPRAFWTHFSRLKSMLTPALSQASSRCPRSVHASSFNRPLAASITLPNAMTGSCWRCSRSPVWCC